MTVKGSLPTYLIIITSCQVFKINVGGIKMLFFCQNRLKSLSASTRAQTPVVISVTESGNYWTFLFKPQATSKLRRSYSHTLPFLPLHSPTDTLSEFGQSKQHCALWRSLSPKSPRAPPGLVLHQQKLEVSPESGVQWSCPQGIPGSKHQKYVC